MERKTRSQHLRKAMNERLPRLRSGSATDARALIENLFERYPDPPDLPPREYDVHDRSAARQAILRKWKRAP